MIPEDVSPIIHLVPPYDKDTAEQRVLNLIAKDDFEEAFVGCVFKDVQQLIDCLSMVFFVSPIKKKTVTNIHSQTEWFQLQSRSTGAQYEIILNTFGYDPINALGTTTRIINFVKTADAKS